MNFINKEDYVFVILEFLNNSFQSLFKLTSILGSCNERGHIKRYYSLVSKFLRHITLCNLQSKSFNNCSFTNAGFTDENRVVFPAPCKNMGNPFNLLLSSYHRIKLAFLCKLCKIPSKLIKVWRRCPLCSFPLPCNSLQEIGNLSSESVVIKAIASEYPSGKSKPFLGKGYEEMLWPNVSMS